MQMLTKIAGMKGRFIRRVPYILNRHFICGTNITYFSFTIFYYLSLSKRRKINPIHTQEFETI